MKKTDDLHILESDRLISPAELKRKLPMPESSNRTVIRSRNSIRAIIDGDDPRMLAITGPCSIHDPDAALEYASRLLTLQEELEERLYIIMRVYFEKPRTTVGWRGLILDPHLDGSGAIADGLAIGRRLLQKITSMGLPTATEMLDPIVPQYTADLISWAAIGARTTESQTHRDMASGLSMPIGFKNNPDGNLQIALDAIAAARERHSFLGIDQDGRTCMLRTSGNPHTHIILRGSRSGSNYQREHIVETADLLTAAGFNPAIMVDCSHGNSGKKSRRQAIVLESVLQSRVSGLSSIIGFMLESNLMPGRQDIPDNLKDLKFGVSITDECIGWEKTEELLRRTYIALSSHSKSH